MRRFLLFLFTLTYVHTFAQLSESFTDGNLDSSPLWIGNTDKFIINSSLQAQSAASSTSVSFIATNSNAIKNAEWSCDISINYNPSSANYACFYVAADAENLTQSNGYYIQIGNTKDEVSLYKQSGSEKIKIIDGTDGRVNLSKVEIKVKLSCDSLGKWTLYSKLPQENDFFMEGTCVDSTYKISNYAGLLYSNSSSTGSAYIFDNVSITGEKHVDRINPEVKSMELISNMQMQIAFTERIEFGDYAFFIHPSQNSRISNVEINAAQNGVLLTFPEQIKKGVRYSLSLYGVRDYSFNELQQTEYTFGIKEDLVIGDIVINEIQYDAPTGGEEYVEIYNKSNKVLDISGIKITTRKTDKSLNSGSSIPEGTIIYPSQQIALCEHPDGLIAYYQTPDSCRYAKMSNFPSLSNEGADLVLCSANYSIIYDEVQYRPEWQISLISKQQGVALERLNPALPSNLASSWHSAASEVDYGTPGYQNSQYTGNNNTTSKKSFEAEKQEFTPNNDGIDDVLIVNYQMQESGWIANAMVYDASGQAIKKLSNNQVLGAEGQIIWDGTTDSKLTANVGIYVVLIESFHPALGEKRREKLVAVVAGK